MYKMKKEERPLITQGLYDVDMAASGMNILVQVFDRHNIDCPETKRFLSKREKVLSRINPNDRDAAKKEIDRIFNGGCPNKESPTFLGKLFAEFVSCRQQFFDLVKLINLVAYPEYKVIYEVLMKDPLIKYNHPGKFMARVKDFYQEKCLASMVRYIGIENVSTLISDGMLTRVDPDLDKMTDYVLKDKKCKFKITVAKKPFAISEEKRASLLPPEHATGIDWGDIPCFDHSTEDMVEYIDTLGVTKYGIRPIEFKAGIKLEVINANCGAGKTHTVGQAIEYKRQELGREPNVLLLGSRVLQTQDIISTYRSVLPHLKHYQDDLKNSTDWDTLLTGEGPMQIVLQYESAWRLWKLKKHFDIFVFDEARQCMSQSCSVKTNRDKLLVNFEVVRALLTGLADFTIMLDADIEFDGLIRDLVLNSYAPHQVELHRYQQYQPLIRDVLYYRDDDELCKDMVEFLETRGTDARVFITFRQKARLLTIRNTLQKAIPHLNFLSIYDKCDESHSAAVTEINEYLVRNNINVFLCTSKLTVGLNVLVVFDRVYGFSSGSQGCTALNTTQGMARCRKVTDPTIRMTIGKDRFKHSVLRFKQALDDLVNDTKKTKAYGHAIMNFVKYDAKIDDWFFLNGIHEKMFGHTRALEQTSYQFSFEKLCHMKGWKIAYMDNVNTKSTTKSEQLAEQKRLRIQLCNDYAVTLKGLVLMDPLDWETILEQTVSISDEMTNQKTIIYLLKRFRYQDHTPAKRKELVSHLIGIEDDPDSKIPPGNDIWKLSKQDGSEFTPLLEYHWYNMYLDSEIRVILSDARAIEYSKGRAGNFSTFRKPRFEKIKKIIDSLPTEFTVHDLEGPHADVDANTVKTLKHLLNKVGLTPVFTRETKQGAGNKRLRHHNIGPTTMVDRYAEYVSINPRTVHILDILHDQEMGGDVVVEPVDVIVPTTVIMPPPPPPVTVVTPPIPPPPSHIMPWRQIGPVVDDEFLADLKRRKRAMDRSTPEKRQKLRRWGMDTEGYVDFKGLNERSPYRW
jgi:hypothetical protein